jgi:hypothetical protein
VCVDNYNYPASLEKRKIYVALRDPEPDKHGLLRIVDESGDDYLYPKALFRSIVLPQGVRKAILRRLKRRHCEERERRSNPGQVLQASSVCPGLLRFARNDGVVSLLGG